MSVVKPLPVAKAKTIKFAPDRGRQKEVMLLNMIERRQSDVDTETGQIMKHSATRFKVFDEDKGYLFFAKSYARRMFNSVTLSDQVKDKYDFMRCHLLAEHIYKDTNMIAYRVSARKIRPADVEDIAKIIGLSYKKTKEFLSRMRKAQVIAERTDKVGNSVSVKYYFNPIFVCSKKYLSAELYFLFQSSLDCYLPEWVKIKFQEISNIKQEKKEGDG